MDSGIVISQTDKRPIYLQIIEQIKRRIAIGDWTEGQTIPSIRQLAVDLQVSVITVKRAYLELERESVIATQQGRGSRVAPTPGLGLRLHQEELQKHLEQAIRLSALLGIKPKELESRLREANDNISAKERS
jgi:DNA-binding transcriptional regulator YhcF (GntR family)